MMLHNFPPLSPSTQIEGPAIHTRRFASTLQLLRDVEPEDWDVNQRLVVLNLLVNELLDTAAVRQALDTQVFDNDELSCWLWQMWGCGVVQSCVYIRVRAAGRIVSSKAKQVHVLSKGLRLCSRIDVLSI
jgi:hypothetical protein